MRFKAQILVKKNIKILTGGPDVAGKGASAQTYLVIKQSGLITRTSVLSKLRWKKL